MVCNVIYYYYFNLLLIIFYSEYVLCSHISHMILYWLSICDEFMPLVQENSSGTLDMYLLTSNLKDLL